jgi:hypothetical protein
VSFAISCLLAQHPRPQIQFFVHRLACLLQVLSDLASRLGPCASLSLRLHQAVKRTFTSKLSNLLDTQKKGAHWQAPLSRPIKKKRLNTCEPA